MRPFSAKPDRGAALLVITMIVLIVLGLIAASVFFQTRTGLKVSTQSKEHQLHFSTASEQMNRVADWIKVWFQNSAASTLDPLVFVVNPNPGGKPQYKTGGLFHHVPLDFAQPTSQQMAEALVTSFATVLNDKSNYFHGWTNPDPNYGGGTCHHECGVFANATTENGMAYQVWATAQEADAAGVCAVGGGNFVAACREKILERGAETAALRITLSSKVTPVSGGPGLKTQRTYWLIGSHQSSFNAALSTGKSNECSHCHLMVYGGFSMPGQNNLMSHSNHWNSSIVTGPGRFGANNLLSYWPSVNAPAATQRRVNCSHPDHSWRCQQLDFGTFQAVDEKYTNHPPGDPAGYFKDGDEYNGTLRFGSIEENVDPSAIQLPPPLRELTASAYRDDFCSPYDNGGNCTNSDDYVLNKYFQISDATRSLLRQSESYSYIKSGGNGFLLVDPGKNRPDSAPTSLDPMLSDGTHQYFSKWIDPTDPAKQYVGVGSTTTDSWGSGSIIRTTGTRSVTDSMGWAAPVGGAVLGDDLVGCGTTYFEGDVLIDSLNYSTTAADCPSQSWTIIAGGNIYITGNITANGNPDLKSAGGQPANGIEFTSTEVSNNSLMLATDGNIVVGNTNSAEMWLKTTHANDNAGPFYATVNDPDPTGNFLDNGVFTSDYDDPVKGPATAGLMIEESNQGRGYREDQRVRIFVGNNPTPTRPSYGIHNAQVNSVGYGYLPLGGTIQTNWNQAQADDSIYKGDPWWQGHDMSEWLKLRHGVPDSDWYSYDYDPAVPGLDTALNPNQGPGKYTVGSAEKNKYVSMVETVEAVLLGGTILATRRHEGLSNEGADWDSPLEPEMRPYYTGNGRQAQYYDADNDGISILGAVIARYNSYLFATGTTAIYRNPNAAAALPLLNPVIRLVRAGEIKVIP